MSTTAPSKRQIATNSVPSRQGLASWAGPYLKSSIGGKCIVAVTGLVATSFVVAHMLGNLQVFLGQDAINAYAQSLKNLGTLLWIARLSLLVAFVMHITLALRLNWKARQARPIAYAHEKTVQASFASRHMVVTGLVILAFVLFHLAHYTFGLVGTATIETGRVVTDTGVRTETQVVKLLDLRDGRGRHDVYSMMVYGFANPIVSVLYLLAQGVLFLHLTHGVASMFQTLGLNTPRAQRAIRALAWTVALVVCVGNAAIVAGVWSGVFPPTPSVERTIGHSPVAVP